MRTVQRWEKQYGLPVHRIGDPGGEIVFAFRDEVDLWLRDRSRARGGLAALDAAQPLVHVNGGHDEPGGAEPAGATVPAADVAPAHPPATRHPRRRAFLLTAVLLLAAVTAAVSALAALRTRPIVAPAAWKVESDTLRVFDAAGTLLWAYRFDGPVHEAAYLDGNHPPGVAIEDLDNDGLPEVVAVAMGAERQHSQVVRCFNADGTLRWQRRLDDRVRFGQEDFGGPWLAFRLWVRPNADGTRSVWAAFVHGMWFPTVLERLDHDGTVRSRYWSNGYVESISEATWQGRRVLLAGGSHNELKGSSLAILDPDDATATAPAANATYQCSTCPSRGPLEFLVFPGSATRKALNEPGSVQGAWATPDGGLVVRVVDTSQETTLPDGTIFYTLDATLRPVKVEPANAYIDLHNWFHKAGRLDRPYTPDEWKRLVPILRWQDGRYVELAPPGP